MYMLGDRCRLRCAGAGDRGLIHTDERLTDYLRGKCPRNYFRPRLTNALSEALVPDDFENGRREFHRLAGGDSSQIILANEFRKLNFGRDDYRHTGGERFD